MLDMTKWTNYPFTAQSVNFVSKIDPKSPMAKKIKELPKGMFEMMNIQMVDELIGDLDEMTLPEIENRLVELNEGMEYAYVGLA